MINIITTQKHLKEVGKEMCESPIVKKVSFTGSTPIAKLIATQAATTLKKYVSSFRKLVTELMFNEYV